jgi:hypothetical protein
MAEDSGVEVESGSEERRASFRTPSSSSFRDMGAFCDDD